jgi:hypothetical protein
MGEDSQRAFEGAYPGAFQIDAMSNASLAGMNDACSKYDRQEGNQMHRPLYDA